MKIKNRKQQEIHQLETLMAPLRKFSPVVREERLEKLIEYSKSLGKPQFFSAVIGRLLPLFRSLLMILRRVFEIAGLSFISIVLLVGGQLLFNVVKLKMSQPVDMVLNSIQEEPPVNELFVENLVPIETKTPTRLISTIQLEAVESTPTETKPTLSEILSQEPTATKLSMEYENSINADFITPQEGEHVSGVGNTRFEVSAYDPAVGMKNGDGIYSVTFALYKLDGTVIHSSTLYDPKFCVFGTTNHCKMMEQDLWSTLHNADYRLTATIHSTNGDVKVISVLFTIQPIED